MSDDPDDSSVSKREHPIPTDRESPIGEPVIRGDETVTGSHARQAVQFDPSNPESLAKAVETVREFATGSETEDHLYMLRGAAACAALVRGEGSYKAAAERASSPIEDDTRENDLQGDETPVHPVTISFIRKWARVHDLPRAVRRQVAMGVIAPSAAKHIARVSGESRFLLAWAAIDGQMTVREVRNVASAINEGIPIEHALAEQDVTFGQLELTLPPGTYRNLRCEASLEGVEPGEIVSEALEAYFDRR